MNVFPVTDFIVREFHKNYDYKEFTTGATEAEVTLPMTPGNPVRIASTISIEVTEDTFIRFNAATNPQIKLLRDRVYTFDRLQVTSFYYQQVTTPGTLKVFVTA